MWPILKKQIFLYIGISLLLTLISLLPFPLTMRVGVYGIVWSVCTLLYNFSPLIFAWGGDYRPLDAMLPVKPIDKYLFYLLYLLVILPASIFLLPACGECLMRSFPGMLEDNLLALLNVTTSHPGALTAVNVLSAVTVTLTCFYIVMNSRRNRILNGVLAVVVSTIAISMLGVVWGAGSLFKAGFEAGVSGKPDIDAEQLNELIGSVIGDSLTIVVIILSLYTIAMLWLIYNIIRRPVHD